MLTLSSFFSQVRRIQLNTFRLHYRYHNNTSNVQVNNLLFLITALKRSCGKVMFLHLSVSHSVHSGLGHVFRGTYPSMQWGRRAVYLVRWGGTVCLGGIYPGVGCLPRGCLHGGYIPKGCLPRPRGRHSPTQQQTSPLALRQTAPFDPEADTPPLREMTIEAGGTHPTGMHTYFYLRIDNLKCVFIWKYFCRKTKYHLFTSCWRLLEFCCWYLLWLSLGN